MASLILDLTPDTELHLRQAAARRGQDPADYARELLEERLATERVETERQAARELADLFSEWRAETPDPEEEAGYPQEITPLSLREVRID
jgi:plasmid stability protein